MMCMEGQVYYSTLTVTGRLQMAGFIKAAKWLTITCIHVRTCMCMYMYINMYVTRNSDTHTYVHVHVHYYVHIYTMYIPNTMKSTKVQNPRRSLYIIYSACANTIRVCATIQYTCIYM